MKKRVIWSWVAGVAVLIGGAQLLPAATCNDGWASPSIGRQGACSHHGGVNRQSHWLLLLYGASIAAGFGVRCLIDRVKPEVLDRRVPAVNESTPAPARVPTGRSPKPVKPGRPPKASATEGFVVGGSANPYGGPREYEALLRRLGIAEDQIQIQLAQMDVREQPLR